MSYSTFLRSRRAILCMSQRDLARHPGVKQPLIAAIEAGSRAPSAETRAALDQAVAIRPSAALHARRDKVRELFSGAGLPEPQVFGSVARGEDHATSDLDLLVEFTDEHDIVDLIDARAAGRVTDRALAGLVAGAAYTVGLGIDEFLAESPHGRVLRNNGRHILIQIATVVEKLPDSFTQARPAVDWIAITRMRNLIAHHYDKVDDRLLFSALQRRVPELMSTLGLDR